MMLEKVEHCLVCGSHEQRLLFVGSDLLYHEEGRFPLVACGSCGFLYLGERPSSSDIDRYYPVEYLSYQKAIEDESSRLRRWERTYERYKRISAIQKYVSKPGRILDIGCATGIFLQGMHQAGWETYGVELSLFAANYARDQFNLNVFQGVLLEAKFNDNSFDVVTLWDVLEHIDNPLETLAEISRILKPGGVLVLGLPNPDSWERRFYGTYWPGWDIPRHFHLFGRKHLQGLFPTLGFEWLGCKSFMGKHGTLVLAVEFWLSRRSKFGRPGRLALSLARSIPARVITMPFYTLATHLNRSSYMTIFAKKVEMA